MSAFTLVVEPDQSLLLLGADGGWPGLCHEILRLCQWCCPLPTERAHSALSPGMSHPLIKMPHMQARVVSSAHPCCSLSVWVYAASEPCAPPALSRTLHWCLRPRSPRSPPGKPSLWLLLDSQPASAGALAARRQSCEVHALGDSPSGARVCNSLYRMRLSPPTQHLTCPAGILVAWTPASPSSTGSFRSAPPDTGFDTFVMLSGAFGRHLAQAALRR